jgi:uncharacterized protein YqeY
MSLQKSITDELKSAIKNRDSARTGAIRVLIGEFQRQPDKELSDDQVIAIIKKLVKSEQELLAATGESGSDFITVLETYLPRQATEQEIGAWIEENIDFSEFKNRMQAMRPIMTHFGSSVDGNMVKKILQELAD